MDSINDFSASSPRDSMDHVGHSTQPSTSTSSLREKLRDCKRKFSESACSSVGQLGSQSTFEAKFVQRVKGHKLSSLVFIEIFSGTAGLCAEVRRHGLLSSVGVDAHVAKRTKSPVLRIHLGEKHGEELLWRILRQDNIAGIHLGPPCGTSSRAREIRRSYGPDPRPLRTDAQPDGLRNLRGKDRQRVVMANCLYNLTARVFRYATNNGIPTTIENPARSLFWKTQWIAPLLQLAEAHVVLFHHCMYGSSRRKQTMLLANFEKITSLKRECDDAHQHESWGRVRNRWATSLEVEYPHGLCVEWANVFIDLMLKAGALPQHSSLMELGDFSSKQARAVSTAQPRGKGLPPLVPEFKAIHTLTGPADHMWKPGQHDWCCPNSIVSVPPCKVIPSFAKLISSHFHGGTGENAEVKLSNVKVGIPWEPHEFIEKAAGIGHPKHFLNAIPKELEKTISHVTSTSTVSIARERTQVARHWMLRAMKLKEEEEMFKNGLPDHCSKVLKTKKLRVFDEMVRSSGYADLGIVKDISRGFDLMGGLPPSNVFEKKTTFGTLLPEHVRMVSSATRKAIFNSSRRVNDEEVAKEICRITEEEVNKGWLVGPLKFGDLAEGSSLTRRFGVKQTSSSSDGQQVVKVRPIDDFSESLINCAVSCNEKISIHSADVIVAGVLKRLELSSLGAIDLKARAIDLRKAYKQLPLSEEALADAYICVADDSGGEPKVYSCSVLPFGAKAAVQGFCRASNALWHLGVSLYKLHWTVYFDDFFLVESYDLVKHTDFVVSSFFETLGWEVTSEKDSGFLSVARILGVCIDLSDCKRCLVSIFNTEQRKSELGSMIDGSLERGTTKKGELPTLRGRLLFAENQIFGRICNKQMRTLSRYAESDHVGPLDTELKSCLKILRHRVVTAVPRCIKAGRRSVWHVYTDACFEGSRKAGIGGVLVDEVGKVRKHFGAFLTDDQTDKLDRLDHTTIIAELEMLAVWVGITVFQNDILDNDLVCFCDNNAVLSSLIAGKTSNDVMRAILQRVFEWEDTNGMNIWYERVESHANIADGPSRGFFDELSGSQGLEIDLEALIDAVRHS